jgi:cyclopropane fatty-acyl-phospholipid synthase-like methyltransferase
MASEFHDLGERVLNSGSHYWGNLGYWQHSDDYSSACRSLAEQLAIELELDENSQIFDAGFGCGDQLLLWLNQYKARSIYGINYSQCQTDLAKKRLAQKRLAKLSPENISPENQSYQLASDNIHYGNIEDLCSQSQKQHSQHPLDKLKHEAIINRVIALDCAYHFPSRERFFSYSQQILTSQGRIGLADIVLSDKKLSWCEKSLLNTMLFLSRIPKQNIIPLHEYQQQLSDHGFIHIHSQNITEHVFMPFAQWLKHYKQEFYKLESAATDAKKGLKQKKSAWLKYDVTARFLAWAYQKNILSFVIVSAQKP